MKVTIIGSFGRINAGDMLRMEKDTAADKINVIKPGYGKAGIISTLPFNKTVPAKDIMERFEDGTYIVARDKEGIFITADVIIPVDFCYQAILEAKCSRDII